jgi:hypothetical protein
MSIFITWRLDSVGDEHVLVLTMKKWEKTLSTTALGSPW